ncbi:MAG: amino acid adenylation domain-containing protein, partial [Spirulina sp.]
RCVCQLIETQVERTPDRIAIAFNNRVLTYRELNERSNQVARYLQTFSVNTEVLVGVCVERSLDMVVSLLGVLKAGAAYVPLDPTYPLHRLQYIIKDAKLPILLTQKSFLDRLPQPDGVEVICLDTCRTVIQREKTNNLASSISPDALAYTIYTSGSTGQPKGVRVPHRSVVNFLDSMGDQPGLTAEDILLAVTTISFDIHVLEIYLPLIVGAKLVVAPREVVGNASRLAEQIRQSGATVMQATPATWQLLLGANWQGEKHLKILCGGEAMTRSLADRLFERARELWNMYGPTETTVWSAIHRVRPGEGAIPLGHPIANTQIYVLARAEDGSLQSVAGGTVGEIYIGGEGVTSGYLNRPDLTRERFLHDPFQSDPQARLYKTGDLGRYRPDGQLEFIDRVDRQVKIRGHRIELGEIENAIAQYSGIQETAVVAKEDISGGQRLVAYVVANPEESTNPSCNRQVQRQVQKWQDVWSAAYRHANQNPLFDYSGWHSSYTGLPLPEAEVREWVDCAVTRILRLQPRQVLEIGCGKGMLLFQIAPHCDRYVGTDLSPDAIAHIASQLPRLQGDWSGVSVKQGAADELEDLEPASFDTVILNSVIQYFPSLDYLVQVIEKIIPLIKPGGHIFIGDVRNLPLLEAFHTSVQLNRAPASLSTLQLRQRIREQIEQEGELVVHPDFFLALKEYFPQIAFVQTLLKEGVSQNELVVFRSDVILSIEPRKTAIAASPIYFDWQQQNWSFSAMLHWLRQNQADIIKIENIPNPRIASDLQAAQILHTNDLPETVGGLRGKLVTERPDPQAHPETWWKLGLLLDYQVDIDWSDVPAKCCRECCYDVVLRRTFIDPLPERKIEVKPLREYANEPAQVSAQQNLIPQLREFLQTQLPEYMIPSIFMPLKALPLTPNGKTDRRALPEPPNTRPLLDKTFVSPETAIQKKLAKIWSQILGLEKIGIHDSFPELGGHSLLTVQLLSQIEAEFRVEISLIEFLQDPTLDGLANALLSRQKSDDRPLTVDKAFAIDIHQDTVLDPTIYPRKMFLGSRAEPEHIFLTGVTGFLGAFFLQELLKQTDAKIYCLVRAKKLADGKHRLQQNLKRYLLWEQTWDSRLIPVLGDLTKPMFGLANEEFRELAHGMDVIYHCGAFINLIYPYSVLRKPNVLGTREVLRLASQGRVTPIHFISTFDVFLSPHYSQRDVLYEEESILHPEQLANGYAQSKWVAEQLLLTARERGIPASIYRLPMISGHSQTGVANPEDLLSRFITGTIQLGSAPLLDRPLSMIPVDYVNKAIVHVSRQPESLNKVFHFSNPHPLPCDRFVKTLREMGYHLCELPYQQWLKKLQHPQFAYNNVLSPLAALLSKTGEDNLTYLETTLFSTQIIDCQNTLTHLRGASIVCPPVNSQLIKTYVSHLHRNDAIARIYKCVSQNNSNTLVSREMHL